MAYSVVDIANLALIRIGVKNISSLTENSVQAITANTTWQYIRDEVLSVKEWAFAKTRVALAKNLIAPAYGFSYAYTLPTDFLRLCSQDSADASVFPSGLYSEEYETGNSIITTSFTNYKIETISDGSLCLVTNYDNSTDNIYITYIRRITDVSKFSPLFINALAFRWAAEMAINRTETRSKFSDMMALYQSSLRTAESLNQSLNYLHEETGTNSWTTGGR